MFDKLQMNICKKTYVINFYVKSALIYIAVRITISIIDLNDNYPIFTSSVDANNTVTEAAAAGVTIGSITATDDDGYPEYNTVSYYIEYVKTLHSYSFSKPLLFLIGQLMAHLTDWWKLANLLVC